MPKTLSFDVLQQGLGKLQSLGVIDETFFVHDHEIKLRTLRTTEHQQINKYVQEYLSQYEGEDSSFALDATMDFFRIRKVELLSYSIQQIDDLDLSGVEWVETGEVNQEGVPKKITKERFLRRLLNTWDPAVLDVCHRKYSELVEISEEKAAELVKFRDPEVELKRVEAKRKELLKKLGREDELEPNDADTDEETPENEDLTRDQLRQMAFDSLTDEQAEQVLREREQSAQPNEPQKQIEENEKADEPEDIEREVSGQRFVRLDDPDEPLTEEEEQYYAEQERLYQERLKEDPEADTEASDAKANLQKRRGGRKPLNQSAPQITEGPLPSEANLHRAPRTRRDDFDASEIPLADGYENIEPEQLGGKPNRGGGQNDVNQKPAGGINPHFKGNQ